MPGSSALKTLYTLWTFQTPSSPPCCLAGFGSESHQHHNIFRTHSRTGIVSLVLISQGLQCISCTAGPTGISTHSQARLQEHIFVCIWALKKKTLKTLRNSWTADVLLFALLCHPWILQNWQLRTAQLLLKSVKWSILALAPPRVAFLAILKSGKSPNSENSQLKKSLRSQTTLRTLTTLQLSKPSVPLSWPFGCFCGGPGHSEVGRKSEEKFA